MSDTQMTLAEIENDIAAIVIDIIGHSAIGDTQIKPFDNLRLMYPIDSLDLIEILMSIEEHFEIDIDDGTASAFNNVREAAVVVEKELSKKAKSVAPENAAIIESKVLVRLRENRLWLTNEVRLEFGVELTFNSALHYSVSHHDAAKFESIESAIRWIQIFGYSEDEVEFFSYDVVIQKVNIS